MEDKSPEKESGDQAKGLEPVKEGGIEAAVTKGESKPLKSAPSAKTEAGGSKFRSQDGAFIWKRGDKVDRSPIKKDFEAAEILDYSNDNRDQQVVFTCEHSSNK